ncbi:hypothetical protein PLESTB_001727700 [Pleodorina starrii]|uniref:Uncharacterized protein n=1 Tax=Pleodorina starrii TaxID=330485 RepID=A0A9W6C127_9CHLO|nr:hypothetical protein PLESTB_001727700 [Pleodorina starrii]GLC75755.1 hypothetical protein PLESTF_001682100 [Pleodorina starrii]
MALRFFFLKAVQPVTARSSLIGANRFMERLGSKLGAAATPSAMCAITKAPGYADEGRLVSHINGFCWLNGKELQRKFQRYEFSANEEQLLSRMGNFSGAAATPSAITQAQGYADDERLVSHMNGFCWLSGKKLHRKFQPYEFSANEERLLSRTSNFGKKSADRPRCNLVAKDKVPAASAACVRSGCNLSVKSAEQKVSHEHQAPRYMRDTASSKAKRVVQ